MEGLWRKGGGDGSRVTEEPRLCNSATMQIKSHHNHKRFFVLAKQNETGKCGGRMHDLGMGGGEGGEGGGKEREGTEKEVGGRESEREKREMA